MLWWCRADAKSDEANQKLILEENLLEAGKTLILDRCGPV